MIPKTIHYCWFGRNPKPELAQKCMASWKRFCPDYEIIEWNEDNFIIESAPLYVRQAYEAKKWAFVTDYVRLYVLYNYGGVYMDTDVEVVRPIDRFLRHEAFSGFEMETAIPTGIMAAEKHHPLVLKLMNEYNMINFYNEDGSLNTTTNVSYITQYMSQSGFLLNNTLQTVQGFTFYPNDFFCPKSYVTGRINMTENTYTIHHFNGSWMSPEELDAIEEYRKSSVRNARFIPRTIRRVKSFIKALVIKN